MTEALHAPVVGSGPRVMLLHCDAATGATGWRRQRPLADRWTLVTPDRPGYGTSPRVRVDFEVEAAAHVPLLGDDAHVVGHSNGGVAAMYVAACAPHLVRSLTLVEPPAFGISDDPAVVAVRDRLIALWDEGEEDPFEFWNRFAATIGERPWPRPPLPEPFEDGVRAVMGSRGPWEARPDFATIAAADFPVLVVSGGHLDAFEVVADTIAERTGGARAVLGGRQHMVPMVGEPFNELVEEHWARAERAVGAAPGRGAGEAGGPDSGQAPRASA